MGTKSFLGIKAAGRFHGNTDIVLAELLRAARQRGHDVETVDLSRLDIRHCTGCFGCNNAEMSCVVKDDPPRLAKKLLRADAILLAAPCFAIGAPSTLKAVMDRTAAMALERISSGASPAYGAAVLVGGAQDRWVSMERLLPAEFLKLYNCRTVGMFTIGGLGLRAEILLAPSWIRRIRELGEHVVSSVERGALDPYAFTEDAGALVCPSCRSDAFRIDRKGGATCVVCGAGIHGGGIRCFRPLERLLRDRAGDESEGTFTPAHAREHTEYIGGKIAHGMGSADELQKRLDAYLATGLVAKEDYRLPQTASADTGRVRWSTEGEEVFARAVPRVLQGFVRKAVESRAQARGIELITGEVFHAIKRESGN